MARVPNLPVRARLVDPRSGLIAREWIEFFEAQRLALGGDAATTNPPSLAVDPLPPIGVARSGVAMLAPVSGGVAAVNGLEPV